MRQFPSNPRLKPFLLVSIMAAVVAVVSAATFALLYQTALDQQKARLVEMAKSRAQFIQAVARFDTQYSRDDHPEGAIGATLGQVREAHRHFSGFGDSGEFTLAKREGDNIVFLISHRHYDLNQPKPVAMNASVAEPMRRALGGLSGTLIGLDYRGAEVLAAHEPLPELGWGIVAKIDVSEVREPFLTAGLIAVNIALILIMVGTAAFLRITEPLVSRLHDSEAQLRSAIATAADGFISISTNGQIEIFNRAAEDIFGYHANEVLGENIKILMPEPDRARHDGYLRNYLFSGESRVLGRTREVTALHKDGTLFPLRLSVSEVRDDNGDIKSFTGIVRDISEEKRMELELRQHAAVFQHAREAIMIMDADSRIIQVNRAFSEITGFSPDEILGHTPNSLFTRSKEPGSSFQYLPQQTVEVDGAYQGDVWLRSKDGDILPVWVTTSTVKDSADHVHQYIRIFTDISERKLAEERMLYLAHHDPLTGLANRSLFFENCNYAISRARRDGNRFAVLFLDLDNFKPINDQFGHEVGDELLRRVAKRLIELLRSEDTIARLGGDEFTIILEEVHVVDDVVEVAQKIVSRLKQPFEISGLSLDISTSIGISLFPDSAEDVKTLLQKADSAMYKAKQARCGHYITD